MLEFVYPLIHIIPFYMQCLIKSSISWILLTVFEISVISHLAEDRLNYEAAKFASATPPDWTPLDSRLIIHTIALEPSTTGFKLLFCK